MTEQNTQRRYDNLYQPRPFILPSGGTPPTTGSRDGDAFHYKLTAATTGAANAIRWAFEYDAADAYWYPIGAAPLYQQVLTSESTTSATYAALTTPGPSITAPLAGDYTIEIGAILTTATTAAPWMSFDIGVAGAVDADAIKFSQLVTGAQLVSAARTTLHTGLASGTAIVAKYKSVGGASVTFDSRWMRITPLRVH